jgi:hypothetical protein
VTLSRLACAGLKTETALWYVPLYPPKATNAPSPGTATTEPPSLARDERISNEQTFLHVKLSVPSLWRSSIHMSGQPDALLPPPKTYQQWPSSAAEQPARAAGFGPVIGGSCHVLVAVSRYQRSWKVCPTAPPPKVSKYLHQCNNNFSVGPTAH